MDRFADRRFGEFASGLAREGLGWDSFFYRNELSFSPVFQRVSPPLIRWIADRRGRILSREIMSDLFARHFSGDITGNGWRAMLDRHDWKALADAARRSARPDPVPVRMRTLAGEPRPGIVRMTLVAEPDEAPLWRSEEHTSELQSLMRISYAVFCLKKKKKINNTKTKMTMDKSTK